MSPFFSLAGATGLTVIRSPWQMVGCMLVPGARKRTPRPRLNKSPLSRAKLGDEVRVFDARSAFFTVSITSNPQEPGLEQGSAGRPQCMLSEPRVPLVLQKARTAHLASKLTRFTSGFLYSFFLVFSKVFPYWFSQFSRSHSAGSLQLAANNVSFTI
jgi:hypothetical protein